MPAKGQIKKNAKARTKRDRAYDASPARKKARAARNKARRQLEREGKVRKGDGKHVDHKDHNTSNGSRSNLRARSAKSNMKDNKGAGRPRKPQKGRR